VAEPSGPVGASGRRGGGLLKQGTKRGGRGWWRNCVRRELFGQPMTAWQTNPDHQGGFVCSFSTEEDRVFMVRKRARGAREKTGPTGRAGEGGV